MAATGGQLLAAGDTFSPGQASWGQEILRWTGHRWVRYPVPASGPGSVSAVAGIPGGGTRIAGSTGDNTGETGNTSILPLLARRF